MQAGLHHEVRHSLTVHMGQRMGRLLIRRFTESDLRYIVRYIFRCNISVPPFGDRNLNNPPDSRRVRHEIGVHLILLQ